MPQTLLQIFAVQRPLQRSVSNVKIAEPVDSGSSQRKKKPMLLDQVRSSFSIGVVLCPDTGSVLAGGRECSGLQLVGTSYFLSTT